MVGLFVMSLSGVHELCGVEGCSRMCLRFSDDVGGTHGIPTEGLADVGLTIRSYLMCTIMMKPKAHFDLSSLLTVHVLGCI